MANLTPKQKRWIVMELAVYNPPKAVAEAFGEEFGLVVDRRQVWEYDLSKPANREGRSADLVELFDSTRAAYQEATKDVAIANKRWRMEEYQRLFEEARGDKGRKMQMSILEQVAKEEGGLYTNKRDVTSNGQTVKAYVGFDPEEV